MKKLTALFLSLALMLTVVPTAFAATKVMPAGVLQSIKVNGSEANSLLPGSTVEVEVVFDVSGSAYTGKISAYDFEFDASTNNDDVEVDTVRNFSAGDNLIGARIRLDVSDGMAASSSQKVRLTVKMTPDDTTSKRYFRAATFKDYLVVDFEEFNIDDLYDAYEEMKDYDEDYMFFSPNVAVINKDAVKFMRSKLKSSQYCYLDFTNYGIGITGAAAKKLSLKAINFGAKTSAVEEVEAALEKAKYYDDVDYLTFSSGDKLDTTLRVGVTPDCGGSYVYRYLGNGLFYQYKTYESDNYDLEFDAYIMETYIITESKLPKSIVYKSGTTASASKAEADDAADKTEDKTSSSDKKTTSSSNKNTSSTTKKLTLTIKKK